MGEAKALAAELAALVDLLVPGDAAFPPASEVGVQAKLVDRLTLMRGEAAMRELAEALAACGGPLAPLDEAGRTVVLTRIERERPDDFLVIRNIVYLSYYESPAVHAAIRAMGFTYHATPLPEGYDVGRFDTATDTPRHGRGAFVPTGEVRRVDLSGLDFLGGRHG
ncbi:MAG TPA: hypothetical protein VFV80_03335 [Geminicoccaceae bacterium]|nr:hypothetical protein [Geminicoccaceae bacterium]